MLEGGPATDAGERITHGMEGAGISYGLAAGAGLISFLSPCVLPIVPGYLCFVASTSLDQLTDDARPDPALARRVVVSAVLFVLGFSVVFVALGASASAINDLIFRHIDVINKIAGAVIVIFGLHYMGLFRIPLLNREARLHPESVPTGALGAFLIGLAFAFGWTPCVGPILATILTMAANNESLGYGVSLLGAYALGLGVPFVLAALAVRPFMSFLRRVRHHLRKVQLATGGLLVITGAMIFTGSLSVLSYYLLEIFPAFAAIG